MRPLISTLVLLATFSLCAQIDSTFLAPNVFSPNGDEINDRFKFSTQNVTNLECTIYNRWGQVVHYFYGVNGYWDGRLPSGEIAKEGVYYYTVSYTVTDNENKQAHGKIHLFK